MKTIEVQTLTKMFLAGAKNLEAKKEWINELNVFPVPDGDTGTNMTLTIMAAASEVNNLPEYTMETVAKAISSGSLRGARGNSGVILSQLFRGFTRGIREEAVLTVPVFADAFEKICIVLNRVLFLIVFYRSFHFLFTAHYFFLL